MRAKLGIVLAAVVAVGVPVTALAQTTSAGRRQVTFTKDVAPIIMRSCVGCHRPEDIAPMSLRTFNEVRPWARAIKDRVAKREMPPWFIDKRIGIQKFKDDRSLSDEEIATIVEWVDRGAPQGNSADMPPMPQFGDNKAWAIGTPDLVVKYPVLKVPAAGPDLYGSAYAPLNLEEDRYIKAIESRPADPASRKVVHHALSYASDPSAINDTTPGAATSFAAGEQFLVEYASGKSAEIYPEDTGVLVRAGRNARVSYHLHSIGEEVSAQFELAIQFYPKGYVPKIVRWAKTLAWQNNSLDLGPGQVTRVEGFERFDKPVMITMWQPHMHIRGKYQCINAIYPTNPVKIETLNCASWNYNWHTAYNYADDVMPIFPAGTIIQVVSWMDNSTSNKFNPDARNWTGDGGRTIDEMATSWVGWYDLTDEEYKAAAAARKIMRQSN
jgi:hypothetical protein